MIRNLVISLVASVSLVACGGGGGGGGGTTQPQPQPQTIQFSQSGSVYEFLGDPVYLNIANGGNGTGPTTYASNNPSVASVDSTTGTVTINAIGSAQITAAKAADASYLSASASYILNIAPRTVRITAWVGPNDVDVMLSPEASVLELAKTSDLECDPEFFAACTDGSVVTLPSVSFVDSVAKLSRKVAYSLKHGNHFTPAIVVPENRFEFPFTQDAVVFGGRLWVIAGDSFPPAHIWSSSDGLNWRKESDNVPVRAETRLLAFNNALWLLAAGADSGGQSNEVWRSTDGKQWSQVTQIAPYPVRGYFATTVFNGRMWISGGTSTQPINDVWSSADGASWTLATSAAFLRREQHEMISFGGRMWIVGGYQSGVMLSDVWSSVNGITWTQETDTAEFGRRFGHKLVADSNKMWLIGGANEYQSVQSDVWSSSDGKSWSRVTDDTEFGQYIYPIAAVWNSQLWVIKSPNQVWSSPTGAVWTKRSTTAVMPGRWAAASSTEFQGRLWLLGESLQLWSTTDGLSWTEEVHQMPGFANVGGTSRAQLLSFNGKLLLVGGLQYDGTNYVREMWQSADGRTWSKLANPLPLAAELSQVVIFASKLWAFGGTDVDGYAAEMWSSTDGVNWTRVSAPATFGRRTAAQLVAFNNKLWAIGGAAPADFKGDVWSTQDGITWVQTPSVTGLPVGVYGAAIVVNSQMCIYDLSSAPLLRNSVWCSLDGQTWVKKSDDVPHGPIAALNGTLFAIGSSAAQPSITDAVWKSTDGISWRVGYQNSFQFP